MTPDEFETRVYRDCLRILRFLASKRYDTAGRHLAALALLAEEQTESRLSGQLIVTEDPDDLRLLEVFGQHDEDREP